MPCIMAGMGKRDSYAARWCPKEASIVFLCRGALGCCCSRARVRGISLGSDWWRLQCRKLWIFRSFSSSTRYSSSLSWCRGRFLWSDVQQTVGFSLLLLYVVVDVRVVWSCSLPVVVHDRCPWFRLCGFRGGAAGAVPGRWWTSLCSCSDEIQLSFLTAGMRGRLFRALYTGTGPGAVSTGTRLP